MERNDKCFCGSGMKYKKCHYHINGESVIANIYKIRVKYNEKCNTLSTCGSCKNGCFKCCNNNFCISEQEFLLILDYLEINNYNIEKYINKSKLVIKYAKDKYPQILEQFNKKLSNQQFNLSNIILLFDTEIHGVDWPYCIFLENGKCSIYDIRPCICRMYGTTMQCDLIGNSDINIDERDDLFNTAYYLYNGDQKILIRPYPIYYWFGHFMGDNTRYKKMYSKLKQIRELKSEDYVRIYPLLSIK